MKQTAVFIPFNIVLLTLTVAAFPAMAFAESRTNINVENNTGGNTVCVNGKCTTSEGSGESTVCVNGKCWDSTNGDVQYKSEDGNTNVNITSNSKSVTVQQNNNESSKTNIDVTNDANDIAPTIKQQVQGAKDNLQAKKDEAEKKIDEATKGFDIMTFIKTEFEEVKSFFNLEFIFGNKD